MLFRSVSFLAVTLITPSELGGSVPMCGGRASPFRLLVVNLEGRVHVGAVLKQELVVVGSPELRKSDGSNPNNEGGEGSPELAGKEEEVLNVGHGASLSVENLEVPEIVLLLRVQVADILGCMTDHAPVLLEPSYRRVDCSGLAALSLQDVDKVSVLDHVQLVGGNRQSRRLGRLE